MNLLKHHRHLNLSVVWTLLAAKKECRMCPLRAILASCIKQHSK